MANKSSKGFKVHLTYAQQMCDARETVIKSAKEWEIDGQALCMCGGKSGCKMETLSRTVRKLLKLEKGEQDGKEV